MRLWEHANIQIIHVDSQEVAKRVEAGPARLCLVSPSASIVIRLQCRRPTRAQCMRLVLRAASHAEVWAAMKTDGIQDCCTTTKISRGVPLDGHSPAAVIPNPREPLIRFTTHSVGLSRMLQTWAHTVRDLQRLTFSSFHFNVLCLFGDSIALSF